MMLTVAEFKVLGDFPTKLLSDSPPFTQEALNNMTS